MKKLSAFLLSILLLLSLTACEFLFRQDPLPDESIQPTASTTPTDVVPPSIEPSTEPEVEPSATPEIEEPEPSESPEPSVPPEETKELTVYVGGASLTAVAIPYSGELRGDALGFEMFYDNASYGVEYKNNAYLFTPLAEDANPADYMEISFINGGKAEAILPSFADSYIDFTDIEFASYTPVGAKNLSAESIIAYNSEQYINAYLIDVDAGVVTIVLSSSSQYSGNFAWFNAMLATFIAE